MDAEADTKQEVRQAVTFKTHFPATCLFLHVGPSPKDSTVFQNRTTSYGPSIQPHEPKRIFYNQTMTSVLVNIAVGLRRGVGNHRLWCRLFSVGQTGTGRNGDEI